MPRVTRIGLASPNNGSKRRDLQPLATNVLLVHNGFDLYHRRNLVAGEGIMLIYRKTSTLAVRHVFDPHTLGTVAEAVVKDGARTLGRVAEEAAGKLAGDMVRKLAENVRSHFTDHSEDLTESLDLSNDRAWKTIEIAMGG